jgi:hypothetical protein
MGFFRQFPVGTSGAARLRRLATSATDRKKRLLLVIVVSLKKLFSSAPRYFEQDAVMRCEFETISEQLIDIVFIEMFP